MYTDDRGQIVFLDTPGVNKPKNKLGKYMREETASGLKDVDIICYLIEPDSYIGDNEEEIISIIKDTRPSIKAILLPKKKALFFAFI